MAITRATNLAGLGTVFDALTDGGGLEITSGVATFSQLNVGSAGTIVTTLESGNVGINSTQPNSSLSIGGTVSDIKLDIEGNIAFKTPYGGTISAYNGYALDNDGEFLLISQGTLGKDVGLHIRGGNVGSRDWAIKSQGNSNNLVIQADSGSEIISINEQGSIGIGTTSVTNDQKLEIRETESNELNVFLHCRNSGIANTAAIGFLALNSGGGLAGGYIGYDASTELFKVNGRTSLWAYDHLTINTFGNIGFNTVGSAHTENTYKFVCRGSNNYTASFLETSGKRSIDIILGGSNSSSSGSIIRNSQEDSNGNLALKQYFRFWDQGVRYEARDNIDDVNVVDYFDIRDDGYVRFFSDFNGLQFKGNTGTDDALDDYEEGTWTPTYSSTSSANPTYNAGTFISSGTYTKIGNVVTADFNIDFNDSTAVSLDDRITMAGLPFVPSTTAIHGIGTFWIYYTFSSGNNVMGHVGSGTNSDAFYLYVTHVDGSVTWASALRGTITYIT